MVFKRFLIILFGFCCLLYVFSVVFKACDAEKRCFYMDFATLDVKNRCFSNELATSDAKNRCFCEECVGQLVQPASPTS